MSEPVSDNLHTIENNLLEAVEPELVKYNTFRIIELPINATAREIDKRRQAIEMATGAKLPIPPGPGRIYPLADRPDADMLDKALQRVQSPELRLRDELFWFWPEAAHDGANDEALAALARGDQAAAIALWYKHESSSEPGVATHNLAVYGLVQALEWKPNDAAVVRAEHDNCWYYAHVRWRKLLDDDHFWQRIAQRISELDDPRLPADAWRILRKQLPQMLLLLNARLALQASAQDNEAEAKHQVSIMVRSGFGQALVADCLHRVTEPLCQRVRLIAGNAEKEADADPPHSGAPVQRLAEQAVPLLAQIDWLLPTDDFIRNGLHDEVAKRIHGCLLTYAKATEDWSLTAELLEKASSIAVSPTLQKRIRDDIKTVQDNVVSSLCFYCQKNKAEDKAAIEVKLYGEVTRTPMIGGTRINWRNATVKVPRCSSCKAVHDKTSHKTTAAGVIMFVSLIACVAMLCAERQALGIVLGAVWLASLVYMLVVSSRKDKTVRQQASSKEYPPIAELLARGYQIGEKPTQ
ncbi:MAG: hypothetical protein LLG44_09070 [Chloroflexi bacterium]|nr:hypothetical protein [Chloroflexota bacterium]